MFTTGPGNTGNTFTDWLSTHGTISSTLADRVSTHGTIDNAVAARIVDLWGDPDEAGHLAPYILELAYNDEHHEASLQDDTFFTDHDTAGQLIHEARNLATIIDG